MTGELLRLWLLALLFAVVLMTLTWRLALRLGNAGIVDIAWAAGSHRWCCGSPLPAAARRHGVH